VIVMRKFRKQLRLLVMMALLPFAAAAQSPSAQQSGTLDSEIDVFLTDYHAKNGLQPLAGHGQHFESEGSTYDVDPRLVTAIAGAETSFGAYTASTNNAFNWFWNAGTGSHNSPFDNWDSGIHTVSHYLHKSYLLKGYTTIPLIGARYCAAGCENWVPNVTSFYHQMGGDPVGALTYPAALHSEPAPTPAAVVETLSLSATLAIDSTNKNVSKQNLALIVQATLENAGSHTARSVELYREDQPAPVKLVTLQRVPGSPASAPVFAAAFTLPASDTNVRLQVHAQITQKGHPASQLTTGPLIVPKPPSEIPWLMIGVGAGGFLMLACIVVLAVLLLRRKSIAAPQTAVVQMPGDAHKAAAAATESMPVVARTGTDAQ
jgi:hypothetical protein